MNIETLTRKAELGDPEAQYDLASMHLKHEAHLDCTEAVKWFHKAAEQGHTEALCELGRLYLAGQAHPDARGEAMNSWCQAAESGEANPHFAIGLVWALGRIMPPNMVAAALREMGYGLVLKPIYKTWNDYLARTNPPTQDFVDAVLNRKDPPLETRLSFD